MEIGERIDTLPQLKEVADDKQYISDSYGVVRYAADVYQEYTGEDILDLLWRGIEVCEKPEQPKHKQPPVMSETVRKLFDKRICNCFFGDIYMR